MLKKLPNEIVNYIESYVYINCEECRKKYVESEGRKDITTIYYRAIFDDDFPFPRIYKYHKFICNYCLCKLKEEYIKPI
jgi:hypothetical protein